jgi:hypothetical protein
MLSVAGKYLTEHNPPARLTMFGQELNPESYAICKADITCLTPDFVAMMPSQCSQAACALYALVWYDPTLLQTFRSSRLNF